jgi:uncharacterized protein (TIGR00255 family)
MTRSMTAYGRGEVETQDQKWVVELRSLNHRFLELSLNMPKRLWALEDRVRKIIKGRISRGRVEMQLTWESLGEKATVLRLDKRMVQRARFVLQELQAYADIPEPLRVDQFLHFSDLIIARDTEALEMEETWKIVSQAVSKALDALEEMRLTEGSALAADLAGSLVVIRQEVDRITVQALQLPQLWRETLMARLADLLKETIPVDDARLAQEAAIMADRRDVAEELARLESHLAQFQQTLETPGPVGRKQEFLLQELLREINTIGAKAGDLLISQAVLEVKGCLERLREQVQNIE